MGRFGGNTQRYDMGGDYERFDPEKHIQQELEELEKPLGFLRFGGGKGRNIAVLALYLLLSGVFLTAVLIVVGLVIYLLNNSDLYNKLTGLF